MDKIIKTQIEKYGEIWRTHIPRYNPKSIIYLDMISQKLNLKIQHALLHTIFLFRFHKKLFRS